MAAGIATLAEAAEASSAGEPTYAAALPAASGTGEADSTTAPAYKCSCGGTCGGTCPACAAARAETVLVPVYSIGRLRPRIPTLGLEKEIAQATKRKPELKTKSDEEALCAVLTAPEFEYLAREICWVFSASDVDAFVVKANDATALRWVLDTVRPNKGAADLDVVIGRMAGRASVVECNGLVLPLVAPAQIYSFDRTAFTKSIQRPKDIDEAVFHSAVKQTLDVTGQMGSNYGLSDGHRALNYLVTRYAELYELVARQLSEGVTLTALRAQPSSLTGSRRVIEVVLHFRSRQTDVPRSFAARVDVTELFPFLVTQMAPYIAMI